MSGWIVAAIVVVLWVRAERRAHQVGEALDYITGGILDDGLRSGRIKPDYWLLESPHSQRALAAYRAEAQRKEDGDAGR